MKSGSMAAFAAASPPELQGEPDDEPQQTLDDRIQKAIDALYDAQSWLAETNYEQVHAAVEDARGMLYGVEEELDVMATEQEQEAATESEGPENKP